MVHVPGLSLSVTAYRNFERSREERYVDGDAFICSVISQAVIVCRMTPALHISCNYTIQTGMSLAAAVRAIDKGRAASQVKGW
jgi:hypothetical protein